MTTYGKKYIEYLLNYLINFEGLTELHLEHKCTPVQYVPGCHIFLYLLISSWPEPLWNSLSININSSLVVQTVKNLHAKQETWVWSLGREDPLEEGKAAHSSFLAWRIPMDKGAWQDTVHGIPESDITEQLSTHFTHYCVFLLVNTGRKT